MIQAISTEKAKFIEGEKRDAVDGLLKVVAAAEDREKAEQLFIETDTDDSGELDAQELLVLMQRIGIQMDLELIEEAINAVDVDGPQIAPTSTRFGELEYFNACPCCEVGGFPVVVGG